MNLSGMIVKYFIQNADDQGKYSKSTWATLNSPPTLITQNSVVNLHTKEYDTILLVKQMVMSVKRYSKTRNPER
jgi:hypothetical protein